MVLASGVAALAATFTTFLNRGDHAIFSDTTYIAAYRLLNQILPEKYGIETSILDTSDPENVRAALRPNTKLVHIETPANPTLKVSDIATIAKLAHEANPDILVSVDNTFNTPYNVRPLDLGADIVIESLTKYINGHGDALGGSIATTKARTDQIRFTAQVNFGGIISPFNAWLINRGSVPLPLRIRRDPSPHHAGEHLRAALRRLGLGDCQASRIAGCGAFRGVPRSGIAPAPRGGGQPAGPPGLRVRRRAVVRPRHQS